MYAYVVVEVKDEGERVDSVFTDITFANKYCERKEIEAKLSWAKQLLKHVEETGKFPSWVWKMKEEEWRTSYEVRIKPLYDACIGEPTQEQKEQTIWPV